MATATEVILLEKVDKLGLMGEVVKVKPGYARNFLLPQGKALRATKGNIAYFEAEKATLEAANKKKADEASKLAKKIDGKTINLIRAASEAGHLYGSVNSRDITDAVEAETSVKAERSQVEMNQNFKEIGLFDVVIALHPEVKATVTLNIARTEDEAKEQAKLGRALIASETEEVQAAAADAAKEELLDDEALKAEKAAAAAEAAEAEAPAEEATEEAAQA
ncbi:MAG: 50S ribosomal protein L9 [Pseudomonadota bacterium]|nr:50S ribosomal protein L9 [Alphaproteobacteria bacterium]MEC9236143.1 50S ribosomal protein L9 [Pseudomonadota bacterium]MED5422932.1 50S ribosomal protein L9 [Pseudomonadota bacterium]|tara:strand:- start:3456 stop:4118 length:663 start_codon:yes stop_codon:yes gene_type:complete